MQGKAKILVADDESNALGALFELLCDEGYEVATAKDGHEALAQLDTFAPDVLLADIRMPGMDGIRLVQAARAHPLRPAVVLMSAWRPPGSPPARFLPKPIELDRLLSLLDEVLAERRAELAVYPR